ncbi:MAG: hypothetical protein ABIQ86_10770 [Steroidobacteraceae bacterium]
MSLPGAKPVPKPGKWKPGGRSIEKKSLVSLFGIGVFVWAFDFKAAASGKAAAFQAVMLGAYLLSYLRITLAAEDRGIRLGSLWALILATAAFVIGGSVVGLTEGQVPYEILVNVIPPFMYVSASLMTYITLRASGDDLPSFLNFARRACLAFAVIHIAVLIMTRGSLDLTKSRFEVLSGAVIPSLGIAAVALIQRLTKMDILALIFNLMVTLMSVTRTLFVVLAAQIAAVFMALPSAVFRQSAIKGSSLFALLAIVVAAVDIGAGTGLIGRWVDRMTVSSRVGFDPTSLTRTAESHFMKERFEASTRSMLVGNGMAAVTSLSGPDAQRAASIVGREAVYIHGSGYGHQAYWSILFIAGVIGGAGLLIIQFLNGLQAIALLRRIQLIAPGTTGINEHIGAWGAIIVIGIVAFGFWAGTLGDRATCLWYGIGTGMLYWGREVIQAPKPAPKFLAHKNRQVIIKPPGTG